MSPMLIHNISSKILNGILSEILNAQLRQSPGFHLYFIQIFCPKEISEHTVYLLQSSSFILKLFSK